MPLLEDEYDELRNPFDRTPDTSVASRDPNEDLSLEGRARDIYSDDDGDDLAAPPSPPPAPALSVKNYIQARTSGRAPLPPPPIASKGDYSSDPLMKQYEAKEQDLQDYRQAQLEANRSLSLGQAVAQAAQGANTPTSSTDLFKNVQEGGKELLQSTEGDLDRRQKIVNAIEQRQSREAVTNNTNAYRNISLQMRQNQNDLTNKTRDDRLSSLNIGRTNALFSGGNLPKETTKLNTGRSIQTLVDGIRSGDITDTKTVRTQLTNMINLVESGTPGGVSDRQAMGVDNLFSMLKDLKNKMTYDGPLSGTISAPYLSQLETEAHALGDRAAKNYAIGTQSILQGANLAGDNPEIDPGQIHKLVTQRAKAFLTQNGYDPTTGDPLNRKGAGVKSGGLMNSANAGGGKTPVKKQYSASRNQTKIVYNDGTEDVVDGKQ